MTFTEPQLSAIEAAFRRLAAAINKRTSVGLYCEVTQLLERIDRNATTAADETVLAALPNEALVQLGYEPTEFVRFVYLVYELE